MGETLTTPKDGRKKNNTEKIFLVILTGGKTDSETFAITGINLKSLLSYTGRLLGDIALDAAIQTRKYFIKSKVQIEMFGQENLLEKHFGDRLKSAGGKIVAMPENTKLFDVFEKAISDKNDDDRIIFIASDLPFLSSETLNELIKESWEKEGIYYPTIDENVVPVHLRPMKTFKSLNRVKYTGGSVIAGKAGDFKKASIYARKLIAYKKNPIKMAQVFGLTTMLALISGSWGPSKLAKKITQKTGITLIPFLTDDWRLAIDVDSWSDLQIIEGPRIADAK